MTSLTNRGEHFSFNNGSQLPTVDPSIWSVDGLDEDDVLTFDQLYGMNGSVDLTAFDDPNLTRPMQGAAPPANRFPPHPVQYQDMKPVCNFPLTSNHASSLPVLPTQGHPPPLLSHMSPEPTRQSLPMKQLPQIAAARPPSYSSFERFPANNVSQSPPKQNGATAEKSAPFSPATETAMVTFVDLKPFYEKGQCRLQGKSEQRLDYACAFVRIYLAKPENIKAKAAFVERAPDAAHILKDNVGRVALKILPDESSSWIKVNLDDAGSEVYKLSKVKGEERNRFRIVLELLFSETNQRRTYYSDTFQVKSKPKSNDMLGADGMFDDGDNKPTIKFEADLKKKPAKRSRTDDQELMTSSPLSIGSSVFPEVITDHLQATTADIEHLKVNRPIQTQRGDVAYHFKLNDYPSHLALEEGDVIGLFEGDKGKTEIKRLTCENVRSAKLAGVISRSAWIEGKTPAESEKDPTDVVCVIGVVKVKVRGPVENGERIYASLALFPGVAMPENVITHVTSNELTLIGQSLESVKESPPDRVNLVSCFVSILLSIQTKHTAKALDEMRSDVLGDVDGKIATEKRRLIRGLAWKIAAVLVFLALLTVLLYQLYAPSTAYRYWKCKRGSISGSKSSFTFTTFSLQVARVNGVEFHFEDLMDKLDLSRNTIRKVSDPYRNITAGYRYYLNVDRCAAGGLRNGVYGPQFFVMGAACNVAYYFHPGNYYKKYASGREFFCSFSSGTAREQDCSSGINPQLGSASFTYVPRSKPKRTRARGEEVTFDVLRSKIKRKSLRELKRDKTEVRYYFNVDKCAHQADGPTMFAIVGPRCNNTYYFSCSSWKKYNSARNIECSPPFKQFSVTPQH